MAQTITFTQAPDQAQLNPRFTQDYESELTSHKRWNIFWKVAALASVIAFAVLTAVATAFTYLTAPIYLPVLFTAVLAFALSPAYNFFEWMWKGKAGAHREAIEIIEPIVDQMKSLPDSDDKLSNELLKIGVEEIHSTQVKLSDFKPLLGEYKAGEEALVAAAKKADEITRELFTEKKFTFSYVNGKDVEEFDVDVETHGKIDNITDPKSHLAYQAVQGKYTQLSELETGQCLLRIKLAYLIHLMRHPHETRQLNEQCRTYEFLSLEARDNARKQNDVDWNTFARRLDNSKVFTLEDLKGKNPVQLTRLLFSGTGTE